MKWMRIRLHVEEAERWPVRIESIGRGFVLSIKKMCVVSTDSCFVSYLGRYSRLDFQPRMNTWRYQARHGTEMPVVAVLSQYLSLVQKGHKTVYVLGRFDNNNFVKRISRIPSTACQDLGLNSPL